MLQSIELQKLRNSEYIQFTNQFLTIVNTHNPTTLQVKPGYDDLLAKITNIESIFKSKQGSKITDTLKEKDILRDNCITGIYYAILSNSYHFAPAKKAAATALLDVLKVYGSGIATQNYNAETATLKSLITDLKLPENVAHTNELGITPWVLEMETHNNSFDTLFLERNRETGLDQNDSIEYKRIACNIAYHNLKDMINSYYTITNKATIYVNCINELNALVAYYNNLLVNRIGNNDVEAPVEGGASNPV